MSRKRRIFQKTCNNKVLSERTPWGGGKKRGEENLANDPSQKWFWIPPSFGTFFAPLCVAASSFPLERGRRPDQMLFSRVPNIFWRALCSVRFPPPHNIMFCTPHVMAQLALICHQAQAILKQFVTLFWGHPSGGFSHYCWGCAHCFRRSSRIFMDE